jgi:O-antigen ligase
LSVLGLSCLVFTYYALHHGSYSLLDRQQIAVFVWIAIGVAAICGVLPTVKPPRVLLIPLVAVLAFAAWTLLSLTWTESAERTFAEFARIVGYVGVLVLIWTGVGRTTWRLVAAGLLSAGVLVCFLTLMSRLWPSIFPSDTVTINLKTTRINYPFGYWNAVGCWSAMTVTLCLAYAGHARSAFVRGLTLAVVPICATGLYLSVSRAGFGGAIFGVIVLVLLAQNRWLTFFQTLLAAVGSGALMLVIDGHQEIARGQGSDGAWSVAVAVVIVGAALFAVGYLGKRTGAGTRLRMSRERGRPLGIAGLLIVAVVLVAGAVTVGGEAYDQFTGKQVVVVGKTSPDRLAQLNGNRHNLWDSAWRAFRSEPIHGIGPGTFEFWWGRDGSNGEFVRDVHNVYLEALAETGIIGLLLLLAVFGGLIWSALWARRELLRRRSDSIGIQAGLVAVFFVFLLQASVDWMWESTAIAVFALAAVALAGVAVSEPRERARSSASRSVGLLVAAAAAVILLLPGLANQRQIEKSQAAFREKDYERSALAANKAIEAQSWSATAYSQKALALEGAGEYDAALEAINVAQNKEPYNWRWPLVASNILVQLGEPAKAVEAFNRARNLRRYSEIFGETSPPRR